MTAATMAPAMPDPERRGEGDRERLVDAPDDGRDERFDGRL